MTFAEVGTHM